MRARASLSALVAVVLCGCTAIIGAPDIFFDPTAGGGSLDGGSSEGGTGEGGPGDGGANGDGDVQPDATSCGDTLNSPTNCGRCGHDCLGGSCTAGSCSPVLLQDAGGEPYAIAVDDTAVYYTDISGAAGSVYSITKNAAATRTKLASTTDPLVYDLKLDAARVYFSSGSANNGGAVEMVPLGGGAKQTVAVSAPGASDPRGVTIDAQYIYWVNTSAPLGVQRALKAPAAAVTTLAPSEIDPGTALVDGTVLWWTSKSAGKVRRCTLPACADRGDLTTGLTEPDTLAKNTARLFYASGNSVLQIPKNAPLGPGAVVATNQSLPYALAVDDRELYWINLGDFQQSFVDGDIRRCPVVNGAADCSSTPASAGEVVARPGASLARGIAIDAKAVYWTEQQSGAVYRLAR